MSGRPASKKISLAMAISILLHALLAFFFWRLSGGWERRAASLSESGGVAWFNLNPGGAGSGGEGGRGALAREKLGGTEAKAAPEAQAKPKAKSGNEAPRPQPNKTGALPAKPAEASPPREAAKPPSSGIGGPGEGDGEGAKSGSGGGAGQGEGAGSGGGSGAGQGPGGEGALGSGGSGQGGDSKAVLAKIRSKIARAKRYPRQARSEGLEGVCGIYFAIRPDGSLEFVQVTKSSGYAVLDEEALATVRRAAPFPHYDGPIRFSLRFSLKDL